MKTGWTEQDGEERRVRTETLGHRPESSAPLQPVVHFKSFNHNKVQLQLEELHQKRTLLLKNKFTVKYPPVATPAVPGIYLVCAGIWR